MGKKSAELSYNHCFTLEVTGGDWGWGLWYMWCFIPGRAPLSHSLMNIILDVLKKKVRILKNGEEKSILSLYT